MSEREKLIERLEKYDWYVHTSEGSKRTDAPSQAVAYLREA